jgi:hypothetical protein
MPNASKYISVVSQPPNPACSGFGSALRSASGYAKPLMLSFGGSLHSQQQCSATHGEKETQYE